MALRRTLRDVVPASLRNGLIRAANSRNHLSRTVYGRATYNEDGMATVHNADFMHDQRFARAYEAGRSTGSWPYGDLRWRAYVISWAADRGATLEGDFVECGVNRGGYALTVMHYVDFENLPKTFYLLDTYEGLIEKYISPEEKARGVEAGGFEPCYEAVMRTFGPYRNAVIIKGTVPETLTEVGADKVSFLSIDMNSREPEIAAAEYFWDRLVSGATIVLDDYGWRKHYEQKIAFDEFAKKRGVQVLALPTGQGLLFKP